MRRLRNLAVGRDPDVRDAELFFKSEQPNDQFGSTPSGPVSGACHFKLTVALFDETARAKERPRPEIACAPRAFARVWYECREQGW
jgi:hypothetical protein